MAVPAKAYLPEILQRIASLESQTQSSNVLYACLEARRALELIAYNRLSMHLCDMDAELLKNWQPKRILDFLVKEVDEYAAAGAKISIARPSANKCANQSEMLDNAWIELGLQKEINIRQLNSLYHALSKYLHIAVPSVKTSLSSEFDEDSARRKLKEAVAFLESASSETLLIPFSFESLSFSCSCGFQNKRAKIWLLNGRLFYCGRLGCEESFEVQVLDDQINAVRRVHELTCKACGHEFTIPMAVLSNKENRYRFLCGSCGAEHHLEWRPFYTLRRAVARE